MALSPFGGPAAGVGGMLFGAGGGDAGTDPTSPVQVGGGKNATAQNLLSPHSGARSSLSKGEPLSRSMGQYGKGHSFASPLKSIRGGTGQMRRIRGGLGPGKLGTAGPSGQDYSMKDGDPE
jgi:hypothetical protein